MEETELAASGEVSLSWMEPSSHRAGLQNSGNACNMNAAFPVSDIYPATCYLLLKVILLGLYTVPVMLSSLVKHWLLPFTETAKNMHPSF